MQLPSWDRAIRFSRLQRHFWGQSNSAASTNHHEIKHIPHLHHQHGITSLIKLQRLKTGSSLVEITSSPENKLVGVNSPLHFFIPSHCFHLTNLDISRVSQSLPISSSYLNLIRVILTIRHRNNIF